VNGPPGSLGGQLGSDAVEQFQCVVAITQLNSGDPRVDYFFRRLTRRGPRISTEVRLNNPK